MSLTLHCCEFHDGGTALVDALEDRTSAFGSLKVDGLTTFSFNNLKRLLQLEELGLPCFQDKLAVLSFSAKVRRLDIKNPAKTLSNLDLDSLNIAARQLSIRILHKLRTDFRT